MAPSSTSFKFLCERAKSDRSSCRGCKISIQKGKLRIGVCTIINEKEKDEIQDKQKIAMMESPKWYHIECINKFRNSQKWWLENGPSINEVVGINTIDNEEEKVLLVKLFATLKGEIDEAEVSSKAKSDKKEKKMKNLIKNAVVTPNVTLKDIKKEKTPDSKSLIKRKKGEMKSEEKIKLKTGKKPKVKGEEHQDSIDIPTKLKVETREVGEKGKVVESIKVMSPNASPEISSCYPRAFLSELKDIKEKDKKKILENIEKNSKKSLLQLKELLRQNKQKIGGTKDELVERVSECMVLGGLPKCPLCEVGYLRYINGLYSCSGKFNEDTKSVEKCSYKTDKVERISWKSI